MGRKVAAVVFASALVAVVLSAGARSVAQESGSQPARRLRTSDPPAIFDDTQSAPDQDVQFVRKDLRSQKKQMVAANMDLTDTEAEKFWPVYDRWRRGRKVHPPACRRRRRRDATETEVCAGISQSIVRPANSIVLSDRMEARSHDQPTVGTGASD